MAVIIAFAIILQFVPVSVSAAGEGQKTEAAFSDYYYKTIVISVPNKDTQVVASFDDATFNVTTYFWTS